jgi:putative ABC transport system permease protein
MLKHYFKTAWRNLQRNKIYAAINIAGIAIGLAASWLIALYAGDELSMIIPLQMPTAFTV